jgi:hypothetical protein
MCASAAASVWRTCVSEGEKSGDALRHKNIFCALTKPRNAKSVDTQQESAHSTAQIGTAQWCAWDVNIKNQRGLRNQQKKTNTRTEPNWDGLGVN